jgi:hypothetical protein
MITEFENCAPLKSITPKALAAIARNLLKTPNICNRVINRKSATESVKLNGEV